MTKFRGYHFAISWIALNDEPMDTDPETVSAYISTLLVADLFSKEPATVAADIIKFRRSPAFPYDLKEHPNV